MTTTISHDVPTIGAGPINKKETKHLFKRRSAVSIGVLFIVQVLTAAIGLSLVESFLGGQANRTMLTTGVVLMMFSGILIAAIGVLLYPILKLANKTLAAWVVTIRATEAAVAMAFGIYLLQNLQVVPNHLMWVYILAGAAGVIFTSLLLAANLVPRPIAALGLLGYSLLLLGVALDLPGIVDMHSGTAQALIIPGALFEVIVLPIWLFAKGFKRPEISARTTGQSTPALHA